MENLNFGGPSDQGVRTPPTLPPGKPLFQATPDQHRNVPAEVTVTDIQMPFWSMVVFMVKWVIASIPAIFILLFLGALFSTFLTALFTSIIRR